MNANQFANSLNFIFIISSLKFIIVHPQAIKHLSSHYSSIPRDPNNENLNISFFSTPNSRRVNRPVK